MIRVYINEQKDEMKRLKWIKQNQKRNVQTKEIYIMRNIMKG